MTMDGANQEGLGKRRKLGGICSGWKTGRQTCLTTDRVLARKPKPKPSEVWTSHMGLARSAIVQLVVLLLPIRRGQVMVKILSELERSFHHTAWKAEVTAFICLDNQAF